MGRVRLHITAKPGLDFNVDAGRDYLTVSGDFDYEVEDLDSYVQVRYVGGSGFSYTYRDPEGGLLPGDLVQVPVGPRAELRVASVVSLDRGTFTGPIKEVHSALHPVRLRG